VSLRTCPRPQGALRTKSCVLVLVLGLKSQVLGLETKSLAIIPKTLISSVYYRFITDELKKCWTLAIDILKPMMPVIGAHSVMSHWCDVLSGITQGSILGPVLCVTWGHHYLRQLSKRTQHRCQQYHTGPDWSRGLQLQSTMKSWSQKINLLSLEMQESQDVSFFVHLVFFALLDYFSSMMLLMMFRMCKILLKLPQFTIMCHCGKAI